MEPRSPFCEAARRGARPNNRVEQQLIDLLNLPIREEQNPEISRRVRALDKLVAGLDGRGAMSLIGRLDDPADALARFFDCELHHVTRDRIRTALRQRARTFRSDPTDPTKPDDPAIDERGVQPPVGPTGPPPQRPEPPRPEPPRPPEPPRDPWRPDVRPPRLPIPHTPLDILKRARELINHLERTGDNPALLKRIRRLVERGAQIAGMFIGIWAFFTLSGGKMYLIRRVSDYAILRVLGRWERSGLQPELESILSELLDVMDDVDLDDEPPQPPDPRQPPDVPQRVDPRARGYAIEDRHAIWLRNQGFAELPEYFPGIDFVNGNATTTIQGGQPVKRYVRPSAISLKSTQLVDRKGLLDVLELALEKMRPPFSKSHRGVQVHGLGRKAIHLVFEEGVATIFTPETRRTITELARIARAEGVGFKWFVYVGDRRYEGPEWFRLMKKAE